MEAICSVIYAGQRVATDLTEVTTLRKMLIDKYQSVSSKCGVEVHVGMGWREAI